MRRNTPPIPKALSDQLLLKKPLLWLNPRLGAPLARTESLRSGVQAAQARLARCAGLLSALFPELAASKGRIDSALIRVNALQAAKASDPARDGVWFVKADHALPVAGSIKARGGFHEILAMAEQLALEHGVLAPDDDRRLLAGDAARALFADYTVTVGSTGNLGLSIGIMAAALGFQAVVHMSVDAKAWKKDRLRQRGVQVMEHAGDYAAAVEAGRLQALADPHSYFVDDERSERLFFGYAAAAQGLADQLAAAGRQVDALHPLFVYVPCGVGGAPGGIAFGLKAIYGEYVHCFFAEPVASPCMLVQLASGQDTPVSAYDIGLDNHTLADGLAVGQASPFVSPLMASQLSGVYTVSDEQLYVQLYEMSQTEGIALEPSAAASLNGPLWLAKSEAGRHYLQHNALTQVLPDSTHVIWTTGGSLVPPEEHRRFQEQGALLAGNTDRPSSFGTTGTRDS